MKANDWTRQPKVKGDWAALQIGHQSCRAAEMRVRWYWYFCLAVWLLMSGPYRRTGKYIIWKGTSTLPKELRVLKDFVGICFNLQNPEQLIWHEIPSQRCWSDSHISHEAAPRFMGGADIIRTWVRPVRERDSELLPWKEYMLYYLMFMRYYLFQCTKLKNFSIVSLLPTLFACDLWTSIY